MGERNGGETWTTIPGEQRLGAELWEEALDNNLLQIVLSVIQDGVCILGIDLDILYSNIALKSWYKEKGNGLGHKCYELYHDRNEPCEVCPVLKTIESQQPETAIQYHCSIKGQKKWHRLFSVPIHDHDGNVFMVIEYVRDITNERKSVSEKKLVEDQNEFLQELSARKEKEMYDREKSYVNNVTKAVNSVLGYLEEILDKESYSIVKDQLEMGIMGIPQQMNPKVIRLSEKELTIAKLIRAGYVSKEIADKLCVSKKAVDYHRTNIRKKLGLNNEDNLQDILKEYMKDI